MQRSSRRARIEKAPSARCRQKAMLPQAPTEAGAELEAAATAALGPRLHSARTSGPAPFFRGLHAATDYLGLNKAPVRATAQQQQKPWPRSPRRRASPSPASRPRCRRTRGEARRRGQGGATLRGGDRTRVLEDLQSPDRRPRRRQLDAVRDHRGFGFRNRGFERQFNRPRSPTAAPTAAAPGPAAPEARSTNRGSSQKPFHTSRSDRSLGRACSASQVSAAEGHAASRRARRTRRRASIAAERAPDPAASGRSPWPGRYGKDWRCLRTREATALVRDVEVETVQRRSRRCAARRTSSGAAGSYDSACAELWLERQLEHLVQAHHRDGSSSRCGRLRGCRRGRRGSAPG